MRWVLLIAVVFVAGAARADIYEWKDADGVRHFTNVPEDLPPATREGATIVLQERDRASNAAPAELEAEAPRQATEATSDTPRMAQVVYDRHSLARAYEEGWREAMVAAMEARGTATAPVVQFNAPLVAAVGGPTLQGDYPYVDPYEPLITTSFDRGRSRHRTLRLLLQEQFALDRAGPFVYRERFLPPRHHTATPPNLHPFHARGLPHVPAPRLRVITR